MRDGVSPWPDNRQVPYAQWRAAEDRSAQRRMENDLLRDELARVRRELDAARKGDRE